jgi:hypothetical protein
MPRVRFETMIPAFERAKIFHALDCAATVIGLSLDITTYETGPSDLVTSILIITYFILLLLSRLWLVQ